MAWYGMVWYGIYAFVEVALHEIIMSSPTGLRPFFVHVLKSCMFTDSSRSGSYLCGAKPPNIKATPQEVRPEGS